MNNAITHLQPFHREYLPVEAFNFQTHMEKYGLSKAEAKQVAARMQEEVVYGNDLYQVNVFTESFPSPYIHLSIKRRDKDTIHDWRDLQAIKSMIVGPEHEAVELYPSERRLVDSANQYHLWVLKASGRVFPFGFPERLTLTAQQAEAVGARQRDRAVDVTDTQAPEPAPETTIEINHEI